MEENKIENDEVEIVSGEVVTEDSIEEAKESFLKRGKDIISEEKMQDFEMDVDFFIGKNYDLDRQSEREVRAFELAMTLLEELKKGTDIKDVCRMCVGNAIFNRRSQERIVADTLAKYSDRGKEFVRMWETAKYGKMISYYPEKPFKKDRDEDADDRTILEEQVLSRLEDKKDLEGKLAIVDRELTELEDEASRQNGNNNDHLGDNEEEK